MGINALDQVIQAEEQADRHLAAATQEAKRIRAEAEQSGRQLLLTAEAEAEEAVEQMMAHAAQEAAEISRDVASRSALQYHEIRQAVREKIPAAAGWVMERIVDD